MCLCRGRKDRSGSKQDILTPYTGFAKHFPRTNLGVVQMVRTPHYRFSINFSPQPSLCKKSLSGAFRRYAANVAVQFKEFFRVHLRKQEIDLDRKVLSKTFLFRCQLGYDALTVNSIEEPNGVTICITYSCPPMMFCCAYGGLGLFNVFMVPR